MTASRRRAYAGALALLGGGGVALLVAFGLPWATVEVPVIAGAADAVRMLEFNGRDLYPGPAMAGWVALASVAGILATRSWGRVVVGVIATIAGLVGGLAAGLFATMPAATIEAAVTAQLGSDVAIASSQTFAWVLALLGGLAVMVAGAWTVLRGRRWPVLGARYERRARGVQTLSAWEAQDVGRDPTDDLVE